MRAAWHKRNGGPIVGLPEADRPLVPPAAGEANLTVSVFGDDDVVNRVDLSVTGPDGDEFDARCSPTDTLPGAGATSLCTGLERAEYVVDVASGLVDDEVALVLCSLTLAFDAVPSADLTVAPFVTHCDVFIERPILRVAAFGERGVQLDPPESVRIAELDTGIESTLDCTAAPEGPSADCGALAPGSYVVSPQGEDVVVGCEPTRSTDPSQMSRLADPSFVVGTDGVDRPAVDITCKIEPESPFGDERGITVLIYADEEGPDLRPQVIVDGVDRSDLCIQSTCFGLPAGTATVSATGLLPGQVAETECFGVGPATFEIPEEGELELYCNTVVGAPQIVFALDQFLADDGTVPPVVILDAAGESVGDSCAPAITTGFAFIGCPLPPGNYEIPDQDVPGVGPSSFECDPTVPQPSFITELVRVGPPFEELRAEVGCFRSPPGQNTTLVVEVEGGIDASDVLINGQPASAMPGCNTSPEIVSCQFDGAGDYTPSLAGLPDGTVVVAACAPDTGDGTVTGTAALSSLERSWFCVLTIEGPELPATGPSTTAPGFALVGAVLVLFGSVMVRSTSASRRRFG